MSIIDLSQQAPPHDLSVEICIVGSGSGGATAAWELAQAGHEVVVLEEGGDFPAAKLSERESQMYDQLYMDRGGRATSDLGIAVMQGRVLGGGGVINACDVVSIPDGVLRHWQKRYGLIDFSPQALAPYRDLALADLAANHPDEAQLNRNNRILRSAAQALGWRGDVMLHNRVGCAGVGVCLIGCPLDAKRNPRLVAIPNAIAAGARFFTRARAVRIEAAATDRKRLVVRRLDAQGYHEGAEFQIRAKIVILAANGINSAQLLLRSGIGNEHVGKHLSLQPQLPISALFDEEVRSFRGIPQAYAVTEFEDLDNAEHGWWGFRIESIGGTPGIVAGNLSMYGERGEQLMRSYPHTASALLLTPDDPIGSLRAKASGRVHIDYTLNAEQIGRLRQAAKSAARLYLAAGAREVMVPTTPAISIKSEGEIARIDAMDLRPASAPLISAHQQGTVRFAPSPRDGAADPDGRVYGTRDVYVFDSSGFPSSSASHTMAPILTVSRYLSRRLLSRL